MSQKRVEKSWREVEKIWGITLGHTEILYLESCQIFLRHGSVSSSNSVGPSVGNTFEFLLPLNFFWATVVFDVNELFH